MRSTDRRAGALALGAALLAGACAAPPDPAPPPAPAAQEEIQPVAPGLTSGLEIVWWPADDTGGRVGALLAAFADEAADPLDAGARADWEAAGLRLTPVPASRFVELLGAVTPLVAMDRQWLGRTRSWTQLAGAGRLRLIGRSWLAPTEAGPRVRVDLALQRRAAGRPGAFDVDAPAMPDLASEGPLLDGTIVSLALDETHVYVVTGERPGVLWAPADPAAAPPTASEAAPEPEPDAPGDDTDTPASDEPEPVPEPSTPGEALFALRSPSLPPGAKAVLVLVARTPDRFTLTPPERRRRVSTPAR